VKEENVSAFYWIDQGLGFALSAAASRERLLPIVEAFIIRSGPTVGALHGCCRQVDLVRRLHWLRAHRDISKRSQRRRADNDNEETMNGEPAFASKMYRSPKLSNSDYIIVGAGRPDACSPTRLSADGKNSSVAGAGRRQQL